MANDINNLIKFLRLSRRGEEAEKNATSNNTINATVIDTDENLFIDTATFEDFNKYKRIQGILDNQAATDVFIYNGLNEKKYYIKTKEIDPNGFNYINLENYQSEQVIENTLTAIRIYFEYSNYFFDTINKRVIITSKTLETAYVYNDIIVYDPEKIEIVTGKYVYGFENPTSAFDTITRPMQEPSGLELLKSIFAIASNVSDRIVTLNKSNRLGAIYLIPNIGRNGDNYFVEYVYTKSGKKLFFEKSTELTALYLEFKCEGAFISFLNETILLDPDFDYNDFNRNERRTNFIDDFHDLIILPIERNIASNSEMHFYDAMKTIHYLGNQVLLTLSTISYWKLFEATIARNSLTNKRDLNEEDIFIKLLEIIVKKEPNKDVFLEKLLEKVQKKELTYIEFLYDRINGDNFVKFTKIIFEAWKKSKFITPTDEIYPKQNTFGPLFLPYESEKILGFYFSNASVSFVKNTINVDFETGKHEKRDKIDRFGEASKVEIIDHYTYNPFYPIYIKDLESQETEIKFEKIIPSFFLKVNKDKEFWHNVVKTGEYAIDVATTLSGVGNIAKFRHLVRLGEIGGVVAKMRLLAGVVEITSGVTNTMLKLTGFEDTESGQALQQYLFWLELLSLSGEIGLGVKNVITKNLQRSANEIIGKSENAAKFEKELDNLVEEGKISRKEADEVIEHFEEMVEVERKLGDLIIHESNKSDDISENFFKNIVKQVRESTGLNDFDINLIDRNNEKYQKLFEQWQKGGGYGFFKPTSGPIKVYNGIPGEGKQIYMFAGKTLNRWGEAKFIEFTKYTLQHELFHVEMFMYLKNQTINYMKYWNEIPTYMHEQYVLNRLLKTKNWKQADLIIDLKNINTMRTELKLPEISLDELKNWKFEIELDKIGIKIK